MQLRNKSEEQDVITFQFIHHVAYRLQINVNSHAALTEQS
jgi:hypothetical protein